MVCPFASGPSPTGAIAAAPECRLSARRQSAAATAADVLRFPISRCSWNILLTRPAAALHQRDPPVRGQVLEYVGAAADPMDFDPVNFFTLAQPEVQTRAEVALVSASAVNLIILTRAPAAIFTRRLRRRGWSSRPGARPGSSGCRSAIRS